MVRHWSDKMTCICGWHTYSAQSEARHRHNFPKLCRKPKEKPVNPKDQTFQQILDEAHTAASAAQNGMVENPTAFDCGFAWVTIDGNSPLARFCRKRIKVAEKESGILGRNNAQRLYGDKDYPKGWCFWKPGGSQAQSVHIHVTGANAFRDKLAEHGIRADVGSRLD